MQKKSFSIILVFFLLAGLFPSVLSLAVDSNITSMDYGAAEEVYSNIGDNDVKSSDMLKILRDLPEKRADAGAFSEIMPAAANDVFAVTGVEYRVLTESGDTGTVQVGDGTNPAISTDRVGMTIPTTVSWGGIRYTVTSIGSYAFFGCSLATFTIPDSVTSIGHQAFSFCDSLSIVSIPRSVTSITPGAFGGCRKLSIIHVSPDNPAFSASGWILFNKDKTLLHSYPFASGVPIIPSSVTSVSSHAFLFCTGMTSIFIPESVTSIGSGAFAGCTNLTDIRVSGLSSVFSSTRGILFNKNRSLLINYPSATGSYTIPNSVTSIESFAFFDCGSLTNITIPDSVTSIGFQAFSDCYNLTSVSIPKSVARIDSYAFLRCDNLEGAYFNGRPPSTFGDDVFEETAPGFTIYYLPGQSGWTNPWYGYRTELFDGSVVGNSAFWKEYIDTTKWYERQGFGDNGHLGVDLIKQGDSKDVVAVYDGTVVFAGLGYNSVAGTGPGTGTGNGYTVTMRHVIDGIEFYSFYAHMVAGSLKVESGNFVKCGTSLGTMGNTGNTSGETGIHLHMGIYSMLYGTDSSLSGGQEGYTSSFSSESEYKDYRYASEDKTIEKIYRFYSPKKVIESNGQVIKNNWNKESIIKKGVFACPVDVNVYDSGNALVSSVINNEVRVDILPTFVKGIKGDIKEIYFPTGDDYRIEIIATDDGAMNYSVAEFDSFGVTERKVLINEIPLKKGDVFTGNINDELGTPVENYSLSLGEVIFPVDEDFTGDQVNNIAISLYHTGNGYVCGERFATKGDYISVEAIALEGNCFDGWYENGVKISDAGEIYSFLAATDRSLEARFSPSDVFTVDGIEYKVLVESGNTGAVQVGEGSWNRPAVPATIQGLLTIPATVSWAGITYSVKSIGDYAFADCNSLTSIVVPNSVMTIGDGAFTYCNDLTSAIIGTEVTSIGDYTFYNCSNLTSVVIPDSVTSIGKSAFGYCSSITNLVIPDNVTCVGDEAFAQCSRLTSLVIGNGVTEIESSVFEYCSSLTSVVIGNSVADIGNSAFGYCSSITSIVFPDSVTSIGSMAFSDCSGLTGIVIPNGVMSVGDMAFWQCTSLTNTYFYGPTPLTFGTDVFEGTAPEFTIYYLSGQAGWTTPTWNGYNTEPFGTQTTYSLTGWIRTYNPNNPTTIQLMQGDDEVCSAIIPAESGSGQRDQEFTFQGVAPGTYTLIATKPGHTSFTVQTVVINDKSVDLTQDDSRPEVQLMALRCGDINGDGVIDDRDLTILWLSSNYYKNTAQAANSLCDLNGDGVVDDRDLTILWMAYNYYRGGIIIP